MNAKVRAGNQLLYITTEAEEYIEVTKKMKFLL
jgi:hypothetical protein